MIRSSHRSSVKSTARSARVREKALQLKNRVRQSTERFVLRYQSRMAWWRRAFRTPSFGLLAWASSQARTLWAAFLAILGLSPKAWSKSASRRPQPVRQNLFRSAMYEGLEARQLMAADLEFSTSITSSSEGANTGGPVLVVKNFDLTTATVAERTVSFLIINSSTEAGDVGSNGVPGITGSFVVPAADYTATAGTFDLQAAGAISVSDDQAVEGTEVFVTQISGLGAKLKLGDANGDSITQGLTSHQILDNDTATVSFSNPTSSASETAASVPVELKLSLTTSGTGPASIENTVTVNVSQSGGIASGADFGFPAAPMAVFVAGSANNATAAVNLSLTNDKLVEGTEDAVLSIGTPTGPATSSAGTHNLSITDDDTATVSIVSSASVTEAGGAQNVAVSLTLGGTGTGLAQLAIPISVDVTDAGSGTATSVADYAAIGTQTVTFLAGSVSGDTKNAQVDPVSDGDLEGNESINLQLGNLTVAAGVSLGNAASKVSITDDETATATIDATGTLNEGSPSAPPNVYLNVTGTKSSGTFQLGSGVSVDVNLAAVAATATAGDYSLSPTKVTFTGSTTSLVAPISVVNDGLLEGTEGFSLNITSAPATGPASTPSTVVGVANSSALTIGDDETATIGFLPGVASVNEGGSGAAVLQLKINGTNSGGPVAVGPGVSIAVPISAGGGLATNVADYILTGPGPVPSGALDGATGAVNITAVNDAIVEGTENGTIVLGPISATGPGLTNPIANNGVSTSNFDIVDDDSATVSISGGTVSENGGAQTGPIVSLTFNPGLGSVGTPQLSSGSNPVSLTGIVTDSPGTASAGDYALTAGTSFTFAPGSVAGTTAVTVTPVNDSLFEGTESFTAQIAGFTKLGPSSGTIIANASAAPATVNITDDEQALIKFVNASSDVHETAGAGLVSVQLEITGTPGPLALQSGKSVSANVVTTGGSATTPADFSGLPGTVTFTGGVNGNNGALAAVSVPVVNDGPGEGTETANLGLSGLTGGATVGTFATHAFNIHDRAVSIKAIDTNPIEDAVSNAQFQVSVNTASPNPVVVTFTIDGSSTADFTGPFADYKFGPQVSGSGPFTVTIPAGATSTVFDVDILDDTLFDPNETITLNLVGATSAPTLVVVGSPSTDTMTIKDNETAPVLSIASKTDGAEGNPTAGSDGKFVINITSGIDAPATAIFALSGNALAGTDYTFVSSVGTAAVSGGKLTVSGIPADTKAFEIVVDVINENTIVEETETVVLTPESFTAGSVVVAATSLNITDDDSARVTIGENSDVTIAETAADQAVVFRMRNPASPFGFMTASTPTTVNFTKAQDTDTAYGSDYVLYSNIDTPVTPNTAGNDTFVSPQSLNTGLWNIAAAASIDSASTIPHLTVSGTSNGSIEYYSFTLLEPSVVTLDVDISGVAAAGNDSFVALWAASTGALVASNNDGVVGPGEGTFLSTDSALTTGTLPAGTYVIGLARAAGVSTPANGFGVGSTGLASGTAFALNVSATSPQSAEPTQAIIPAGQSSATMLFNVIDEAGGLLENNEFVEYTLTGFAAPFDPQISVDSETVNTAQDNKFKITIDESTTGNVKIEGTNGNPFGDLAPNRLNAAEPGTNGRFLVTMSSPADQAVVVPFRINTAGSTAKLNDDFKFGSSVAGAGTSTDPYRVTIAIGATTALIDIEVVNDDIVEIDEILQLDLLDVPNSPPSILNQFLAGPDGNAQLTFGTPGSDSIVIKDEDLAVVNVNSSTDKAFEGGTDGVFTIFLSKGKDDGKGNIDALLPTLSNTTTASTETVVTYQITGKGGNGADMDTTKLPLMGVITIPANSTAATVVVDALTDSLNEGSEDVVLEILSITKGDSNLAINKTASKDTVFIVDNNKTTVSIKATDNVGIESPDNDIVFTVTLDGDTIDPAAAITVTYSVSGTATESLDFTTLTKSVVIPAGQTQATILVDVLNDSTVEPVESVILTLVSVSGAPSGVDVTIDTSKASDSADIISEDGGKVSIKAIDSTMSEGSDNALLYVELTNPSATGVLVNYSVSSSSLPTQSTPGSDYVALTGSVFVLPNQTSALIPITVLDDAILETTSENIIVTLTSFGSPAYTLDTPSSQTVTIAPDQTVKVVPGVDATEGVSSGNFIVQLSSPSTTPTLVTYQLSGVAVEGTDFASQVKTAIIPAGSTTVSVVIDPVTVGNDTVLEGSESVVITLLAVANVAPDAGADIKISSVVGENTASINILDDDKAYVTVTAVDGTEGAANGKFTFTLRDANGNPTTSTTPITVNYNLLGSSTATNGGVDYNTLPVSVVIPANATSTEAAVVITNDMIIEGTETVSIDLTGTSDPRVAIGTIAGKTISFQNGFAGYNGTEDIYIDQLAPLNNNEGLGLFANTDSLGIGATTAQQSLLKFGGIFGPGGILPGSKITAANLQLWVPSNFGLFPNPPANGAVSLHEALINWNEALTWDNSDSFGDFVDGISPNGSDAKLAGTSFTLASNLAGAPLLNNIPVTASVQNWSNGQSNFGWAILPNDTINGTFALDSEFVTAGFRPRLQVTVDTSATVKILDDDTSSINIAKVTNAVEDITNGLVTVEISKTIPAGNNLVIDYEVGTGGSATAGSDYTAGKGQITITGGSTSSLFQVPVLLDNLIEGNEDVEVKLLGFSVTGPGAAAVQSGLSLGKSVDLVPIIDNDTAKVDVAVLTSGTEGPAGTSHTDPVFRISLNASSSTLETVVTFTINGGANFVAGQDYVAPSVGSITIPAGSLFTDFTLDLIDDLVDESSETVTLTLTGLTKFNPGIVLGTVVATDTIEDDDVLTVDLVASDAMAKENPTSNKGEFTFSVGASDKSTSVPFTVSGTAALPNFPAKFPSPSVSGPDYGLSGGATLTFTSPTAGTITFPASLTPQTATIDVTAVQDYLSEPGAPETVVLTLGTPTNVNGAVNGAGDSDAVTIEDEDFTVRVAKTDSPAAEDGPPLSGSNGQFTVTIANPIPGANVLVPFTIVNGKVAGTATYDGGLPPGEFGDYVVTGANVSVGSITPSTVTGIATIVAGSTSAIITVDVKEDSLTEGIENVVLSIGTPSDTKGLSKLTIVPAETTATEQITDNDVSRVSISVIDDTDGAGSGDAPGIGEVGTGGQNDGAFRISLDKKVQYAGTVVEFTIQSPATTATRTVDYNLTGPITGGPNTFTLTIPANTDFVDVGLDVLNDLEIEGPEDVVLKVTKVTPAAISPALPGALVGIDGTKDTAKATITDNDTASVSIFAIDADAKEPSNPGIFVVSLPPGMTSKTSTTVTYTTGGTANTGTIGNNDYTPLSGSVVIPAGQNSVTISVVTLDDDIVEADETVVVTLNPTTSNALITAAGSDTVIIDSEDTATVSITASTNGAEDSTAATLTVTITKAADQPITIPLSDLGGTATGGGVDYNLPASITIPAGQLTASISIAVTSDTLVEGTENFVVALNNPSGVYVAPDVTAGGSQSLSIADNDKSVLSFNSPTIKELDSGTSLMTFVVTNPSKVGDAFTVQYKVKGGTAKSVATLPELADYTGGSGTLSFDGSAGQTQTFTITVNGDEVVEANETIIVEFGTVTSPTPAVVAQIDNSGTGTGTIENDDTATITVSSDSQTEGSNLTFNITSDKQIDIPINLSVSYGGGDAKGVSFAAPYTYKFGDDFDNRTDTVTLPAFSKGSVSVVVNTNTDTIVEGLQTVPPLTFGSESFDVSTSVTTTGRSINPVAKATGTILDDDSTVVTVTSKKNPGDDDASEPLAGKGDGLFTFELTPGTSVQAPVVISYTYKINGANGDPNGDLKAPLSGTITIPASIASANISTTLKIEAFDDSILEDDELVELTITGVTTDPNVSFTNTPANQVVNLQDDDSAVITISATDNIATEPGIKAGDTATYTVSLSKLSDTPTTISLAIDAGTTASPSDYTGLPSFVTIPANTLSTTFTITAKDDVISEPDEFLVVKLVPGTIFGNADITIGSPSSDKITIKDDGDDLIVSVKKDRDGQEPGINAADEGQFVVEILDKLGNPAIVPVGSTTGGAGLKIIYSVAGVTATQPNDFNAPTGILTILEGASSGLISIDVTDDSLVEPTESLKITLTAIEDTSGVITALPGTGEKISLGTTSANMDIKDNDVAIFTVEDLVVNEGDGTGTITISISNELVGVSVPVTVNYTALTASFPADFAPVGSQTVTFVPGSLTSQTVTFSIVDDLLIEGLEGFGVTLSTTYTNAPGLQQVNTGDTAVVAILDNDFSPFTVTGVKVGSTGWSAAFNDFVDNTGAPVGQRGYSIPTGAAQATPLPWINLNRVYVSFSQDPDPATLITSNFVLHGLQGALTPSVTAVSYDNVTNIATLTLSGNIVNDRLRLEVKDSLQHLGTPLDGDWANNADTFDSGNGTAGGTFNYTFNVLPGDATLNGLVNTTDAGAVFSRIGASTDGTTTTNAPNGSVYSIFMDVNGSGFINASDASFTFARITVSTSTLPSGSPGVFGANGGSGGINKDYDSVIEALKRQVGTWAPAPINPVDQLFLADGQGGSGLDSLLDDDSSILNGLADQDASDESGLTDSVFEDLF